MKKTNRMGKVMKTATSMLLALAMAASPVIAAPYSAADDAKVSVQAEASESAGSGELHLTLHRPQAMAETTFTATLQSAGQSDKHASVTAPAGNSDPIIISLGDIADGTYTLTVSAPYYLTYTQQLNFTGQCILLDLYNDVTINEERSADDGYFGVIPVGDLNRDNKIDDADADMVTKAVGTPNSICDVSGDGKVSLEDISIVVRNNGQILEATPVNALSTSVLTENVQVSVPEETKVLGSLSTLLDQLSDESVTLSSASGEAISKSNPVEVVMDVNDTVSEDVPVSAQALIIAPPVGSENYMTAGVVEVEGIDIDTGESISIVTKVSGDYEFEAETMTLMSADANSRASEGTASKESDGTVVINLGRRVAIKKITIRVTASANQNNLAEIATVEFLKDFAERIPEPQLSIPTVLSVSNTPTDGLGYKNLSVEWSKEPNVTSYEVSVSGNGYNKTASTTDTRHTFQGDSFNGTVLSFKTYNVRVRSVNGDWKSDWSQAYEYTVTCDTVPPAPQYLTATAGVQSLKVSWNCKYDAEGYTLYYKKVNDENYQSVGEVVTDENGNKTFTLTSSQYTLSNLIGGVNYTMYVVAHNRNGSSSKSSAIVAMPTTPSGVEMPKYKLINVNNDEGLAKTHITSISGNNNKSYTIYKPDGTSVTNNASTPEDWNALLDNNPYSYLSIPDWDSGVNYDNFRGPIIQMDDFYTIDTIRMSPKEGNTSHINRVKIRYKTQDNTYETVNTAFYTRYDGQSRMYYEVIFDKPITTDYLEIRTTTSYTRNYSICEVKLYEYDSIEHDVAALFSDDMHTALNNSVTEENVQELIDRVNVKDEVSGEFHPHKDAIMTELNYAKQLLLEGAAAKLIKVDNQITVTNNPQSGFAQALSDYQPLGTAAAAGDTIIIYVSGGNTPKGNAVKLNLIAAQYHPEVANWQKYVVQLKAGRNEITIPRIGSYMKEAGGSLYLQYTGAKGALNYTLRVSGGTEIPTLNLDGVTGAARTEAIEAYVKELESYAGQIESLHEALHANSDNAYVRYDYSAQECFLNSTEITLENMMYSVPALAVWNAIKADPINKLSSSIAAMEQEVDYFYQFKGMNKNATDKDAYPYTRLNIRYHQMFTGAFMYAGGKHIGIEYGSVGELFNMSPIVTDDNGKYVSGNLSGWGIAHEIGHCINASDYQRVEVTNNMFAQLAKTGDASASETNANFRTTYDNVYKAVAAGTTGHTGNLAVQLAMYWQLHLAYDNDYAYKMYDSIDSQQNALFYARLESYLRDRTKAEPDLPASGSGDQVFMQAACAAAGKNILHFFKAWGFTPSAATIAYAENFDIESRKIQYIDDDSRLYRIQGGEGMSQGTEVTASVTNSENSRINDKKVNISLSNTNTNENAMLGYEIYRNGKMIAFVPASKNSYTDIVTTENNRALTYTVTGVDRLLNETTTIELPEVKVCHDGAIDKSGWTAATNMTSPKDTIVEKNDNDPESGVVNGTTKPGTEKVSAISAALDDDENTVYYGAAPDRNNRPYVILNLGGVEQVSALKFTPAPNNYSGDAAEGTKVNASDLFKYRLFDYRIEVSTDGTSWTTVKEGSAYNGKTPGSKPSAADPNTWSFAEDIISNADGSYTMYFNKQNEDGTMDPFMYTYDAAYVKLTSTSMSAMAVAELDILGPTSDNVELLSDCFGKLTKDYNAGSYADGTECIIPEGSIVFYGSYRGDPSYNAVLLRDQNGDVLDGSQLFFAEVPEKGALGQTSDGRWIFWLENAVKTDSEGTRYNEFDQLEGLETVKAELYRVEDAMTLAGQRMTSTTLTMTVPNEIPNVEITADSKNTASLAFAPAALTSVAYEQAETKTASAFRNSSYTMFTGGNSYYGDTGAAELEVSSPVQLTVNLNKVTVTVDPDEIAIAMSTDITISSAPEKVWVDMLNDNDNLYKAYTYNNGVLTLYAVARRGNIGGVDEADVLANYVVTNLPPASKLTCGNVYELDSMYKTKEKSVPENHSVTTPENYYSIVYNAEDGSADITAPEGTKCYVIFASYDDENVLKSVAAERNVTIGSECTKNIPAPAEFNATGKVKVMLWDSLGGMRPLAECGG